MTRMILPGLAALAFLALSGAVSAQDIKGSAAAQKLAAEKLASQVRDAIARSSKQDPIDAKIVLQRLLRQVEDSTDLYVQERTPLMQDLTRRIRQIDAASRGGTNTGGSTKQPIYRDDPPKYRPADPKGGVSNVAKGFQDSTRTAAEIHNKTIKDKEVGNLAVGMQREKDFIPSSADPIAFPKYWKELTERRKKTVGQQLTEKEVALLKMLNSTMSVNYDGDKFKGVIDHIQDKTKLSILIDEGSLRDANVDYEADTVTFKAEKVTVRTVLKKILGDKGLTYIIKEGAIQVMTPKKASEYTVLRTYQIDDLVSVSPQTQMMFGPFVAQMQMQQNAMQLAQLIMQTIEPNSWQPNGPNSITFFAPTKSLVVRASAEMQYQMSSPGLFGGR